jgi:hypothetical protein
MSSDFTVDPEFLKSGIELSCIPTLDPHTDLILSGSTVDTLPCFQVKKGLYFNVEPFDKKKKLR